MTEQIDPITLAQALAAHGVSATVASRVEAIGRELRAAHASDGNEHGALLDGATGERVAPDVTGQADRLDLSSHLRAMVPGRGYIQLHTHRSGTTISLEDVGLLRDVADVRAMVVAAVDRYWYVLSVSEGEYPAALTDVEEAMWDAFFALRPAYRERVENGEIGRDEAGRALWHEVWRTITPRLGFQYHQVAE